MQTLHVSHSNSEQCEKLVLAANEINTVMPMSARWKLELSRSCDDWEVQKSPYWSTHAPVGMPGILLQRQAFASQHQTGVCLGSILKSQVMTWQTLLSRIQSNSLMWFLSLS